MISVENCDLLKKKEFIESFLSRKPEGLSAFSFVSIFAWKDFFDFELKMINENLCIFAKDKLGCFMYLPPLGARVSQNTIDACFDFMYAHNQGKGISRIDNVPESDLALFDPKAFSFFEKSGEYIYQREDIASLKGNLFKSKRSSYNHFVKSYAHEALPFESHMGQECLSLYDAWAEERTKFHADFVYQDMIKQNRVVHQTVLEHYKELGIIGRVVFVGGAIKAYTFGFPLNSGTFCILFEITDLSLKGLPAYVFKEFCDDAEVRPFSLINVMDDFGLDNIKRTKLSFRPVRMISSYAVSKK